MVQINAQDKTGAAVADAIIVFDPLGAQPVPAHDTAVVDQVDKRFVPRVSVVRTGTAVTFPNSDHIRHQVYSFSPAKPFSLKLYAGSPHAEVIFDKPGLVVLGCNIHDSMVAFIAVVDSPYFVKLPASGAAALTLPPGRYRLRAWHPLMSADFVPRQITVAEETLAIPLTLDVAAAGDTVANWTE